MGLLWSSRASSADSTQKTDHERDASRKRSIKITRLSATYPPLKRATPANCPRKDKLSRLLGRMSIDCPGCARAVGRPPTRRRPARRLSDIDDAPPDKRSYSKTGTA